MGSIDWWKDAVGILQSVLLCVTAVVALFSVNEWRRQTVGKRKIEMAEQVLARFANTVPRACATLTIFPDRS